MSLCQNRPWSLTQQVLRHVHYLPCMQSPAVPKMTSSAMSQCADAVASVRSGVQPDTPEAAEERLKFSFRQRPRKQLVTSPLECTTSAAATKVKKSSCASRRQKVTDLAGSGATSQVKAATFALLQITSCSQMHGLTRSWSCVQEVPVVVTPNPAKPHGAKP